MEKLLNKAITEINGYKDEIIDKLVEFSKTDLILFWDRKTDLYLLQEKEWRPILTWVEKELNVELKISNNLDVPENVGLQEVLRKILFNMSDKELVCCYAAALNMRSVLLALAFVKRKLKAEDVWKLSYLEELWQNNLWGVDEEANAKRLERSRELKDIESYLLK